MIERGLLGDLPEKLKPQPFIPRGRSIHTSLEVAKPTGFLSSCLPIPDSPGHQTPSSDDEGGSPLKKSFSFRDKFSRISLFGKDKDKSKWKTVEETEKSSKPSTDLKRESKAEYDYKNQKRFWFFRNKELEKMKGHSPIYQRSKSFEFLPRAIEEEEEKPEKRKKMLNRQSSAFESDLMGDAWTSNDSLEYISNVYYDNEDGVLLKSIREFPSESSGATSSISAATSASSANAENIFKRGSVQDLLDEFHKAVDMFSESYLSDCEPYTKSGKQVPVEEKRKSNSFSSLPSPRLLQVNKVSEISEEFKRELSKAVRRPAGLARPRRGSVTDWFVLEVDPVAGSPPVRSTAASEQNKYRRGQKKPMNRVRRMSSTKYVSTFVFFDLI